VIVGVVIICKEMMGMMGMAEMVFSRGFVTRRIGVLSSEPYALASGSPEFARR
jgi:hypothetical protein